jgi:DNA-binding transcriptional MerR regulator
MGRGHLKMATVCRLTGFRPELLRAWETRHQLLAPSRGTGGQRLYSDEDLALLLGVRALVAQGRSIGEIATLGRRHLIELARAKTPGDATALAGEAAPADAPTWAARAGGNGGAARTLHVAANAVSRLSARLDAAQLLQLVVDTLADDYQAALARIWVADPTSDVLHLRASAGLSRRTSASSRARIDLRTYRFKVGVVARSGAPFVSNHIVGDGDFDQRWVHTERLASVAILPISDGEMLYGVMAAFFRIALAEQVLGALRIFTAAAAGCLAGGAAAARARLSA